MTPFPSEGKLLEAKVARVESRIFKDGRPADLDGWISTFWEQGMEEPAWLIFQDERFTQGDQWLREGMHELSPGDELTIFAPDGDVLWQGRLDFRRQGWFGPKVLIPREMEHWFHLSPPLRARLIKT